MQSSLALSLGLPAVLCIIMLGLGLSLKLDDFRAVIRHPKPVFIGVACQVLVLPALCLGLVHVAHLPPSMAVGMMLLAASPGGTSATLYTHLARGDVALSITLTAITSALSIVTLPLIVNLSLALLYVDSNPVYLELRQVLQIFAIAIVPAAIGVVIQSRYPGLALRMERPVKIVATVFLVAIVLFALISQWGLLGAWGATVGVAVLAFNLMSLAVGYYVPRLLNVERRQSIALALSISMHNAALVIAIAMSDDLLANSEMAIPPAGYGLVAYITGAMLVWAFNLRARSGAPVGKEAPRGA
ncbi:MAG: bile acid:sodium symporter family protein [Mesorhizobium sp.]|nr:bile acid:sodium symporter family protein [Mesorhizobium sp.]